MSVVNGISGVVTSQFKLILIQSCSGVYEDGGQRYCLDDTWPSLDVQCMFHLITAVLGYVLVVLISMVHTPLLVRILSHQCGQDYVSKVQVLLLVTSSTCDVTYAVSRHLPISTWGESILLMTQYAAMMSLMCIYHGRHRDAIIFMVGYISVVVGLLGGVVGEEGVVGLKVGGLAAAIWLKSSNIVSCLKQPQTPDMALTSKPRVTPHPRLTSSSTVTCDPPMTPQPLGRLTLTILALTSAGRLLTSVADTRDPLMVTCSLVHVVMDVSLMLVAMKVKKSDLKHSCHDGSEAHVKDTVHRCRALSEGEDLDSHCCQRHVFKVEIHQRGCPIARRVKVEISQRGSPIARRIGSFRGEERGRERSLGL